jgi:hypothetical protein
MPRTHSGLVKLPAEGAIEAGNTRAPFEAPKKEKREMESNRRSVMSLAFATAVTVVTALVFTTSTAAQSRTSRPFAGVKANTGSVTLSSDQRVLALSDDFKAPDAPDPHWQVVDNDGRVYLLQKLTVKGLTGDKMNRSITLPAYIKSVAKVQFWCAYAEVLLGEASFGGNSTH